MKLPTFNNPLKLFNPAFAGANPDAMSASGANMMFASTGSGGGGGYDDDDYGYDDDYGFDDDGAPQDEPPAQRPQSNRTRRSSSGRTNANGGRSRTGSYQPGERYWTDYLRIALPVIGIILMLGLLWIWASNLLGGDDADVDNGQEDTVGLVTTHTPDPNEINTEPNAASTPEQTQGEQGSGETTTGEIPISGQAEPTSPTFNPTSTEPPAEGGDNQTDEEAGTGEEEAPPAEETGEIAIDARVEITEPLNVRPSAGTSGEPLWVAEAGDQGTIISGPEEADGYTWWELVFDDGSSGFVIEQYLEVVP